MSAASGLVSDHGGGAFPMPVDDAVLTLQRVSAGYGRTAVLRDVDLTVPAGKIVALLGPNGAGKTTLLRAASGLLSISAGQVQLSGSDVTRQPPYSRASRGLCLVPEGRGIFPNLSVRENLLLQVPPTRQHVGYEPALEAFPILSERLTQRAGSLSGGQRGGDHDTTVVARNSLSQARVTRLPPRSAESTRPRRARPADPRR